MPYLDPGSRAHLRALAGPYIEPLNKTRRHPMAKWTAFPYDAATTPTTPPR
jgi:hypothetical protein